MSKRSMKTIAVANQKGGVAKTTTVVNLAAELARNHRVLVVDFDPQRSATSSVFGNVEFEYSIHDLLFNNAPPDKVIQTSNDFGFDMLPSDIMLSSAELRLASVMGREKVLSHHLNALKPDYDLCLIDTAPTLGLLSVNAIVAADAVLIPISPEYFSLKGIRLLEDTIDSVRKNLDARLALLGVLVTRYRKRIITKSALDVIVDYFGDKVFDAIIDENIRVEEAHNAHLPVGKYDSKCVAAVEYRKLADEILRRLPDAKSR